MLNAHGPARAKLAKLYKIAKARESIRPIAHPADLAWSTRGDLEAISGSESNLLTDSPGWRRFESSGAILVDSALLDDRIVVVKDADTPIPPGYEAHAIWTVQELRKIRSDLRSGAYKLEFFAAMNRVKRELGATVVSGSSPALSGEVTTVEAPGNPLTTLTCLSPARRRNRCTNKIAPGEFTAWFTPDDGDPVPVCLPCSTILPWSPEAKRARQRWAKSEGIPL